jgi:hypothetical protein
MCFPPGFFDITEHLVIHMVDQIRNVDVWAFYVHPQLVRTESCSSWGVHDRGIQYWGCHRVLPRLPKG